ncbi:Ig-like domain-containing protein [Acanthopleuribacter pedis]|uniref:Ig-like domain-containing protein n=1 Tax=Acanthopleuribacter pedis TaxID=442870 RepID=A0A8J7U4U5_9BACT|nr:Ig-like domain-containing protein [Acanthopleuribacter pedis]MBO1321828.1 Ig-like domain-containing protein [Acanthopleuribacter pedis]
MLAAAQPGTRAPNTGDLLQRSDAYYLSHAQLSTLSIDPPAVSLLKTPQTEVTVTAAPTAPSGAWARVHARERHQHVGGTVTLPEHSLDLLLYRDPFDPAAPMRGTLPVHTRRDIQSGQTRSAVVLFTGVAYPPPTGNFRFQNQITLENLTLQLPGDIAQPVNAFADAPTDLPLMNGADLAFGFQWHLGAGAPAPRLRFEHPARTTMILLRRDSADRWLFVGALQNDGGVWHNNDGSCELDQNGFYALVSLDFAIGRFSGQTLYDNQAHPEVLLATPSHPWRAWSGSDGGYHFFLPVWDQAQTVTAHQSITGFHATRAFPSVDPTTQTGVAFNLGRTNLLLVAHTPEAGAVAVPPWRFIDLDFSQPLRWESADLAQHIRLTGPEGAIPLDFTRRFSTSSVRLRARQALNQATTYTVDLDPALQAESGDLLGNPVQFQFTTHARAEETQLDLDAWYLAQENDNLVLHAPADRFPSRSKLTVLNLDTAWSSSETLAAGPLARIIAGNPGHRISVSVTTPGGQTGTRVLDNVRLGDDRVLLGSLPFQVPVGDGLTLAVDQVVTGVGRELRWRDLDPAEDTRLQGQLPASQANLGTAVTGFILESSDGGPVPQIKGRLLADLSAHAALLESNPQQFLALQGITEGVQAPADPRQPDVLAEHTVAVFQDAVPVSTAASGKTAATSGKRGALLYASFQMGTLTTHTAFALALRLAEPETYAAVLTSLRDIVTPPDAAGIDEDELLWAEPQTLRQRGGVTYATISGAPVYEVVGSGDATALRYVGSTGRAGETRILSGAFTGRPSYFVMDPVTQALTSMTPESQGPVIAGMQSMRAYGYLNWPDPGSVGTVNQDVAFEYAVVDLKTIEGRTQPEVTVNTNETRRLEKLGKVKLAENRAVRVTLRAANNPFTEVRFEADYQDGVSVPPNQSGTEVVYRYENLPRDRPFIDLTIRFATDVSQARELERRIWLIGETGTIADDPANPPTVTGSLPADGDRAVPLFDPIQINFSEPVTGVSEANIELREEGGAAVTLVFEDLAGDPIDDTDLVHEVYVRPEKVLKLGHRYTLIVSGVRDQARNALVVHRDDGVSDRYTAVFATQPIEPKRIDQDESSQRGYTQYRNLLVQVSRRGGSRDQREGLTIEVIEPGNDQKTWQVVARHELIAPSPFFPKPALVTQQALATPAGDELAAVEGPSRKAVKQLPAGSVLAVTYWDGNQALNRIFLLRWSGASFEAIGHHALPSPGIINDVIGHGPFLVFGHNAFESIGTQIGRIEVRDLRAYFDKLDQLKEQQVHTNLSPHQRARAFAEAGLAAQFFYPRGVFDLAPFVHTDTQRQVLAFSAAAATFPAVGRLVPGDNRFIAPRDTWYDQRLLFRCHYPVIDGVTRPAEAGKPGRPGGFRLRTAVLPQIGLVDQGNAKVVDLTLFAENFGSADRGDAKALLHFLEVPKDQDGKDRAEPTLPRVSLVFDGRIGNLAADPDSGLIAVTFQENQNTPEPLNVMLLDPRAVYAALQDDPQEPIAVTADAPFVTAVFGAELDNAVGDALFFHEGHLYWTNGKTDLVRQPVSATLRRELGWLSYDMTVWNSDPQQRNAVADTWQRQATVVLHAADIAAAEDDPSQGQSEAVTRAFTTEVGTFQVQLFPGEALELTMKCLDPDWEQSFEVKPLNQPRLISLNTRELSTWLQGQQEILKTRGILAFEIDLRITLNGRSNLAKQFPFVVRYINPPGNDPYRTHGALDLLSRTPSEFAVDDAVSSVDSRIDLSTMRYHHGDLLGSVGTFGVGMRDSGALHLGSAVWFRAKDLPTHITEDRLKADQRILLGQPGLWRIEGDLKEGGERVAVRDDALSKLTYQQKKWTLTHRETMTSTWYSSQPLPAYEPIFRSLNKAEDEADPSAGGIDKKDRIIYPLMRYQAASGTPGALFGRVIERERKDVPWYNQFKRGDLDQGVTDLPTTLSDRPNDGGAQRRVDRTYRPHRFGNLLEVVDRAGGLVEYEYDSDAYLVLVRQSAPDGQNRVTRYRWEDSGIKAGDLPIKRLIAVEQDTNDGPFVVGAWQYAHAKGMTVSAFRDPFCSTDTPYTFELAGGETARVTVPSCDGVTPDWVVTFDASTQQRLSKTWSRGAAAGTLTWARLAFDGLIEGRTVYEQRLVADSFRAQSFVYNNRGFVAESTGDGLRQRTTYHTTAGYQHVPATFDVEPGQDQAAVSLSYAIGPDNRVTITDNVSPGRPTVVQHFSSSGVPTRAEDVTGIATGPTDSLGYYPRGGLIAGSDATHLALKLTPNKGMVSETRFNIWGEPVGGKSLGAETTLTYDRLGRLTQERRGLGEVARRRDYAYRYEDGRRIVTLVDSADGSTTTLNTDQRGLLRAVVVVGGPAPGSRTFVYDDHGRLTESSDGDDASDKTTYRYHGDTDVLTNVTTPAGSLAYTVRAGAGVFVDGLTATPVVGQPDNVPLKVDALGRVVKTRMDGVGTVRLVSDAFGNPLSLQGEAGGTGSGGGVGKATGPRKNQRILVAWTYRPGAVQVADNLNQRETLTRAVDGSWLDVDITETLKPFAFAFNTQSKKGSLPVPHLGNLVTQIHHQVRTELDGNILARRSLNTTSGIQRWTGFDGLGRVTGFESGNRGLTASNPDTATDGAFRTWTGSDGRVLEFTRNAATQTTKTTFGGLESAYGYDARGRLNQSTSPRKLILNYSYQGAGGVIDKVETQHANRADGPLIETDPVAGVSSANRTHRTWLGDAVKVARDTETLGVTTLTRGEATARIVTDTDTGLPASFATFSGETNHISWQADNHQMLLQAPDGTTAQSFYNHYGLLIGRGVNDTAGNFTPTLEIVRDSEQRITELFTATEQLSFSYDGWNLIGVESSDGTRVTYAYATGQTRPHTITTENEGKQLQEVVLTYHDNGQAKCVTVKPAGRAPESFHYNAQGDLIRHQRPHQGSTTVSFNAWGAPQSLTNAGETFQLFEEGNSNQLAFPNNVSVMINERGLTESVAYPGLAAKRFIYDADGRLTGLFEGAEHQARALEWADGRVARITTTPPVSDVTAAELPGIGSETMVPEYDGNGRVVALARTQDSGVGASSREVFTYDPSSGDLGRLQSYQDGNGVVQTYSYDRNHRLNGIWLDEGPSFYFGYDDAGNMTDVAAAGMQVAFGDWQNGYPTAMTWGDGTSFSMRLEGSNRLATVQSADGGFALELGYDGSAQIDGCDSAADYIGGKISRVTRAGPDLREILTPTYNSNHTLASVAVERHIGERGPPGQEGEPAPESGYETLRFDETYGNGDKQLLQNLTLVLRDQALGDGTQRGDIQLRRRVTTDQAGPRIAAQSEAQARVLGQAETPEVTRGRTMTYAAANGNLERIEETDGTDTYFVWDGERRLRAMRKDGRLFTYEYDSRHRRIRATSAAQAYPLVFSYHGSKLIAVGLDLGPKIEWTHAVGHGPLGPAFIVDLRDAANSYYLFNDHLGTPFAYKRVGDGKVFYTPYSPHGESWWDSIQARDATGSETMAGNQAATATSYDLGKGYERPALGIFTEPFLGLSGHKRDADTGLTYMHHRFYDPQLGHFLNPDFRAPNIYDPSTFTEPYAFATGNPMMFWDPNGLISVSQRAQITAGVLWGLTYDNAVGTLNMINFMFRYAYMSRQVRLYKNWGKRRAVLNKPPLLNITRLTKRLMI